jgi:hypothetical protein
MKCKTVQRRKDCNLGNAFPPLTVRLTTLHAVGRPSKIRNASRILTEKPKDKDVYANQDNIKMYINETVWEDVYWINVAHDKIQSCS